jgi:hypothetical protein
MCGLHESSVYLVPALLPRVGTQAPVNMVRDPGHTPNSPGAEAAEKIDEALAAALGG